MISLNIVKVYKFDPVTEEDIPGFDFVQARQQYDNILTTPGRIKEIISSMNKRSACIQGDIPMKLFALSADYLSQPLCNILNSMFISSKYPEIWKTEFITPAAKCDPPNELGHFRPISGLLNCAKVARARTELGSWQLYPKPKSILKTSVVITGLPELANKLLYRTIPDFDNIAEFTGSRIFIKEYCNLTGFL